MVTNLLLVAESYTSLLLDSSAERAAICVLRTLIPPLIDVNRRDRVELRSLAGIRTLVIYNTQHLFLWRG